MRIAKRISLARIENQLAEWQGKGSGGGGIRREVFFALKCLGRQPNVTIDVGANTGDFAAALRAQAGGDFSIHLFEPSRSNIPKLQTRFANDEGIHIAPFALSDVQGTQTLHSDSPGSGWASLTKQRLDHMGATFDYSEDVQTLRFDRYWTDHLDGGRIDIAKLDIEGHELQALTGFGAALSACRVIQFEFGGCNIDTRTFFRDFWYFFTQHGFELNRISPFGLKKVTKYSQADERFEHTIYIATNRNP